MNKVRSNFHTHTTYCDGNNTVREMIEAALDAGFHSLGFTGHGHVSIDPTFGMTPYNTPDYEREVRALAKEYRDKIHIFLGMENDSADIQPLAGYDYSIGSVHYVPAGGGFHSPDDTVEKFVSAMEEYFAGDPYLFAQAYYDEVVRTVTQTRPDIIGHFDSFIKFNRANRFFDEGSKRYRTMAMDALEAVAQTGGIIEINTGAMARGYRDAPYPARFLLERMYELRTPVIISSDAHSTKDIACAFDDAAALLYETGFRERMELTHNGFVAVEL